VAKDVLLSIRCAIDLLINNKTCINETINIAGGNSLNMKEIISIFKLKLGEDLKINIIKHSNFNDRDIYVSNKRTIELIGREPILIHNFLNSQILPRRGGS